MPMAQKSLGDVARLAMLLSDLQDIQASLDYQQVAAKRGKDSADKLRSAITNLAGVLSVLVDEEVSGISAEKFTPPGDLRKTGEQTELAKRADLMAKARTLPLFETLNDIIARLKKIDEVGSRIEGAGRRHSTSAADPIEKIIESLNTDQITHLMFKIAQRAPQLAAPARE